VRAARGAIRAAAGAGPFVLTVDGAGQRVLWEISWTPGRMSWSSDHAVVFIPGSTRLFAGTKVLEVRDGRLAPVGFAHPPGIIWGVAADQARGKLASVTHRGVVRLFDARTLALERVLQGAGDTSWVAAFSPEGDTLAAGTGSEIVLFDPASGAERGRLGAPGGGLVVALAFHPRLPLLAAASLDRKVRLWNRAESREERELLEGVTVHDLAFAGERLLAACADGTIRAWDSDLLRPETIAVSEDPVWAVASGPRGLVVAGSQSGNVRLFDPASWRVLAVFGGVPRVRDLAFDDTGRYLAASTWASSAAVWDLEWLRQRVREIGLDWP
jgi:WD40 repeat protein